VATYQRLNLTHEIRRTIIYTPKDWGTFRISLLMTLNVANVKDANWIGAVRFENGGVRFAGPSIVINTGRRDFESSEVPIRAKADAPITFSVTSTGETENSKYSVFVVVEQLM